VVAHLSPDCRNGLTSRVYGLTAGFSIASATMILLTLLAWRQVAAVDAHSGGLPPADS
jgi:hypothetical protein